MDDATQLERAVAAVVDLADELRATAAWCDERARVLDQVAAQLDPSQEQPGGAGAALRVEAARLRGRAVLIRQVVDKATR